jgi:hypothetical protein
MSIESLAFPYPDPEGDPIDPRPTAHYMNVLGDGGSLQIHGQEHYCRMCLQNLANCAKNRTCFVRTILSGPHAPGQPRGPKNMLTYKTRTQQPQVRRAHRGQST